MKRGSRAEDPIPDLWMTGAAVLAAPGSLLGILVTTQR
jgi:hypothetical protein